MSKFGKKFTCWKCSTKFYDLNKPKAVCPKCSADPEDDPNKGVPMAASATFSDEGVEDVEDEVVEVPEDEELDDDAAEEEAPADDEY